MHYLTAKHRKEHAMQEKEREEWRSLRKPGKEDPEAKNEAIK